MRADEGDVISVYLRCQFVGSNYCTRQHTSKQAWCPASRSKQQFFGILIRGNRCQSARQTGILPLLGEDTPASARARTKVVNLIPLYHRHDSISRE